MGLMNPSPPHFDSATYGDLPYRERVRLGCVDWVHVGFGAPVSAYAFYVIKIALYVGGWWFFASRTSGAVPPCPDLGPATGICAEPTTWWLSTLAFQKAIVWTMLWEGMGLGSGSGPLTGRYWPPIAGFVHFLRPGTTRLPPWPDRIPGTAGTRRTLLDVILYATYLGLGLRVLLATEMPPDIVAPIVVVLAVIGLRDKTIFLASRAEHYWTTLVVFLFAADVIAGSKAVQLAIWWWAATSKLNHHFPYVVTVMLTNHPLLRPLGLRRRLVRGYPDDLRPGRVPTLLAHGGTVIEYSVPLLLVLSDGGLPTLIGLAIMLAFHTYILSSFALGVPQEWNILFMYSAVVLFGANASVKPWDVSSPLLAAFLLVMLIAVPAIGNLRPEWISFLPSMRYYAGNWPCGAWLFRPEALERFDERITKVAPEVMKQLDRFFEPEVNQVSLGRVAAFRAMHLHGRLVQRLIVRAVPDPDDYEIREGELVAGMVLGWNFGDGHLHHEQLLAVVQEACGFEPGDCIAVLVESQPAHRQEHRWRIVDAAGGELDSGTAPISELRAQTPWPD